LHEPRRWFGPRIIERLSPALDLFALAFERIAEHEARFEAVRTLEELTRNIHSEYNRAVKQLKSELDDARSSSAHPLERDASKIAQLERLLSDAQTEVQRRAERLHAVEEQVSQAVERLQQAHVDMHAQAELARAHAGVIYQIEALLQKNRAGADADETISEIRAVLAPRHASAE
jgi:chromosome segregation ATPase